MTMTNIILLSTYLVALCIATLYYKPWWHLIEYCCDKLYCFLNIVCDLHMTIFERSKKLRNSIYAYHYNINFKHRGDYA